MSQHTPGTWAVGVYEATDNFRSIAQHACICDHDTLALIAVTGPATDKQSHDDARLMAAAPDLLAALEGLTAIVAEYRERVIKGEITGRLLEHDYAELAAARAAIRKATEDSTHA